MGWSALIRRGLQPGLSGVFVGAGAVVWGLIRILQDVQLRRLAVIPLVLTGVLYVAVTVALMLYAPDLAAWIWDSQAWTREHWWQAGVYWLIVLIAVGAVFVVLLLLFTTVVEIIGGPFFDKMAVRILDGHHIESHEPGFIEGTIPDVIRSLLFVIPAGVCALLGFVPLVGIAFWGAGSIIAWLGLASAAFNPALLVTGYKLGGRVRFVFAHFFVSLGLGAVVGLSFLVPLLGLVSIPSALVGASELYARSR